MVIKPTVSSLIPAKLSGHSSVQKKHIRIRLRGGRHLRLYRGHYIQITKHGTWVEAAIYTQSGKMVDPIGSGTYGPGVYNALFRRGIAIIDAMHGD